MVVIAPARGARAADVVTLTGQRWSLRIDPATLEINAVLPDGHTTRLAESLERSAISELSTSATEASWRFDTLKVNVNLALEQDALTAQFTADEPGTFHWPTTKSASGDALVFPMFEGLCIPVDDSIWRDYLTDQGPLNALADLSMPFWSVRRGERTVTYILTHPFNSSIRFSLNDDGLAIVHEHEFTRNRPVKTFAVRMELSDESPIAPAKVYRRYLERTGQLVTLNEKIAANPEVEKLLGAPHIYLWGDATISRHDVQDFRGLMKKILADSGSAEPSMGQRIWHAASDETRKLLSEQPTKEYVDDYTKRMVAEAMNAFIEQSDDRAAAKRALSVAYVEYLHPVETWGDGISATMIDLLREAGLDRAWLGAASYDSLVKHPDAAQAAIDAGYLIGPYDSYHSIHSPSEAETWETAQFNQALYESGAIVRADGTKSPGFKKKGFHLSPIAARPFVERRVNRLLQQFDCNSWFIDCDAFGQVFDDYSPLHSAAQQDDMNARLSRLRWIADEHDLVVGSEGGASFAAPAIAFAHGMMSPVIAWGDPDLYDRASKSPYALGKYYPPDGPAVFFKPARLKPEHRRIYFDPKFRVPLYQAALHDSVVATHHWSAPSFKFEDPSHDREILELLYNVPPMYHLNRAEWTKRQTSILRHHEFFSPMHRVAATQPLTDFQWLTKDKLVQRTEFGSDVEIVANFSDRPFLHGGESIPPHSIWARVEGQIARFRPE